ncbi:DNA alkylation repair protein [Chitinimonas sp.]|uniref:DNA alkylation repair protein n=1 Tax=Chitinimonas sp. TaxID=1934313 RepID=UPI002F934DB2
MTPSAFSQAVQALLLPHADPARAADMRAYMRDQFDFLGLPTPLRRSLALPLLKAQAKQPAEALLAQAQALWLLPAREYQYVAVDLLARHHKRLDMTQLEGLLALVQQRSWWDTVDALASVVGDVVHAASRTDVSAQLQMDAALRHPDLWVKRVAMLHQLGWRADVDERRLFDYALVLAPETDFFIRKAIGWALRDYARHAPDTVRAFLAQQGAVLAPLSVREAARHLG